MKPLEARARTCASAEMSAAWQQRADGERVSSERSGLLHVCIAAPWWASIATVSLIGDHCRVSRRATSRATSTVNYESELCCLLILMMAVTRL